MISILIAGNENNKLAGFLKGLEHDKEVKIYQAGNLEEAFHTISTTNLDLVVAGENISDISGISFAEKIVSINPMINCAVVSSLSPENFHEATEGLGLLMQLSVDADASQANTLVNRLKEVLNLTSKSRLCTEGVVKS